MAAASTSGRWRIRLLVAVGGISDEAAFTKDGDNRSEDSMMAHSEKGIKPTLFDYRGQAPVCSNSAGRNPDNFFYNICTDPQYGFHEFHATTLNNPLFRNGLPMKVFRIGILAPALPLLECVGTSPALFAGRELRRLFATPRQLTRCVHYFIGMRRLAMRFRGVLRSKDVQKFGVSLDEAQQSGIYAMQRFARTVRRDLDAVTNALTEGWSNGQTEGQINRLKTLKRAMYGRAGPDSYELECRLSTRRLSTESEADPIACTFSNYLFVAKSLKSLIPDSHG
jgi:hypothetical protein